VIVKFFLPIIIILLFILAFIGGPDYYASRSLKELWNIGHILLFSLFSYYVVKSWSSFLKKNMLYQIIILISITAIISLIIELSQYIFANGTPDLSDVRRNFVGTALGFLFICSIKNKKLLFFLRTLIVIIIILELIPVSLAFADEFRASSKFPILSDFESKLELSRWSGDMPFVRSKTKVLHGKSSLKVTFGTSKYSGVFLNYFPSNWMKYKYLKYNIYYSDIDTLYFTCRIHDEKHEKSIQVYSDRYNRQYFLVKGWNEILISLNDVKNAPKNRIMDMANIRGLGIFTVQLSEPREVYMDYFRLE
jgi:hypothetical protein